MAGHWLGAILFLLQVFSSRPQCSSCRADCEGLNVTETGYLNISTACDAESVKEFLQKSNLSSLQGIDLVHPSLSSFNLTNLSSAQKVNFSHNNLTGVDLSGLENVENLSLSHNRLSFVSGNLTKLKFVDLSYNLIRNISECQILSNVTFISLSDNLITNLNFFSSASLEHLDLKNNLIKTLSVGKIPNLKIFDLSNNSITKISFNISTNLPNLEILNISSNSLQDLANYNFNLTNLLKLDLNNNQLKHLSPKCFAGLNKLQFLDISQNQLKIVSPSTLQYLSGLIQLIVSDNDQLSSQDFGLLLASKRLKSVNASKTNQIKIPSSLIRSVRYLFLSFNNITQIQCGDLDSYPLLNKLDLSHNNIGYIEDDALGRLELLKTITLSYNQLTSIPYTLPNNLKELLLNNNLINKITTTDFSTMTQLETLDLSNNKIVNIAEGSFSQLGVLESMNLSGNSFQVLSSSIFTSQRGLKILDLSHLINVTKCDHVLCFPVPEANNLQKLYLQNSPVLVNRLINDAAALKTFKQLNVLNLSFANLTEVKNDLLNYFPRLRYFNLQGNDLNCSLIYSMYSWLETKQNDCLFSIYDIATTTTAPTTIIKETTNLTEMQLLPTLAGFLDFQSTNDLVKNDIWYKESDLGVVDAFAGSTPTSHPGLLILLVLPIALVSTCLALHYSRSKRQMNIERHCEMDIEISNISSELW